MSNKSKNKTVNVMYMNAYQNDFVPCVAIIMCFTVNRHPQQEGITSLLDG